MSPSDPGGGLNNPQMLAAKMPSTAPPPLPFVYDQKVSALHTETPSPNTTALNISSETLCKLDARRGFHTMTIPQPPHLHMISAP